MPNKIRNIRMPDDEHDRLMGMAKQFDVPAGKLVASLVALADRLPAPVIRVMLEEVSDV